MNLQTPQTAYPSPLPQAQWPWTQSQQYAQPAIPPNRPLSQEEQDAERRRARRLHLQSIAMSTVHAINNNHVEVSNTLRRTRFYPPNTLELSNWMYPPKHPPFQHTVRVSVAPFTTLQGVQYFYNTSASPKRIGVLNFASATRPGGGFMEGARAQEESITRSSSLYVSLGSDIARPFYSLHGQDEKGGFYTHAMIYSPNIHIFRDDAGGWVTPHQVDVLTSPAVNAGKVRKVYKHMDPVRLEQYVQQIMYDRIGRILALFERKGAVNLVLGSFGTGVFKNDVKTMAKIWKALLLDPGARFGRSFETVVFTIPDGDTRTRYEKVFRPHQRHHTDGRN